MIAYKRIILSIIVCVCATGPAFSEEWRQTFVVVKGTKVRLREKATIKSRIVKVLQDGELAFYEGKTDKQESVGDNKNYWYYVKTQKGKKGWIFGQFVLNYNDAEAQKRLEQLIRKELGAYQAAIHPSTFVIIKGVKEIKENNIVVFSYSQTGQHEYIGRQVVYEIDKDKYHRVLTMLLDDKYYIRDDYLFVANEFGVKIYKTNEKERGIVIADENLYYKCVQWLHLSQVIDVLKQEDSYATFDPETLTATMHLRYEKGKPMTIKKFKFYKGKFVPVEQVEAIK